MYIKLSSCSCGEQEIYYIYLRLLNSLFLHMQKYEHYNHCFSVVYFLLLISMIWHSPFASLFIQPPSFVSVNQLYGRNCCICRFALLKTTTQRMATDGLSSLVYKVQIEEELPTHTRIQVLINENDIIKVLFYPYLTTDFLEYSCYAVYGWNSGFFFFF